MWVRGGRVFLGISAGVRSVFGGGRGSGGGGVGGFGCFFFFGCHFEAHCVGARTTVLTACTFAAILRVPFVADQQFQMQKAQVNDQFVHFVVFRVPHATAMVHVTETKGTLDKDDPRQRSETAQTCNLPCRWRCRA